MRILMLGAGAIGGYFGARIHHAGGDITFLTRPARANRLLSHGLQVVSPLGDIDVMPRVVIAGQRNVPAAFDAVILSCKAYDLDSAIEAVAPMLAPEGLVVPLLNGMAHLARLDHEFGRDRVLGGLAHLGVTTGPDGKIKHLNELHRLIIGSRAALPSPQVRALAQVLDNAGIDFSLTDGIEGEMWDKFCFLSVLAGATCTMRASIGDILRTHSGESFILGLLDECCAVAHAYGHTPTQERLEQYRAQLTARTSTSTASMLRDIERQGPTEAEHVLGDMVRRGETHAVDTPFLKLAYSHLQAYEAIRARGTG